jgi:hypothetical protein
MQTARRISSQMDILPGGRYISWPTRSQWCVRTFGYRGASHQVTPEVPLVFQASTSAILDEGETALISAGSFLRRHFEHTHQQEARLQSLAIRAEPNREGKGPNMNDNLISPANQERCP